MSCEDKTTKLLENWRNHIYEKIRSSSKEPFRWNEFREIKDIAKANEYTAIRLHRLGCGTARCAFILTPKTTLKLAGGEAHMRSSNSRVKVDGIKKGIAQNREEARLSDRGAIKHIIAKVLQTAPDHSWIVSELVRPITRKDTESQYGLKINWFENVLNDIGEYEDDIIGYIAKIKEDKYIFSKSPTEEQLQRLARLLEGVVELEKAGLAFGDVADFTHWGKTPDGRIVLLDYGLSHDVWKNFYDVDEAKNKHKKNVYYEPGMQSLWEVVGFHGSKQKIDSWDLGKTTEFGFHFGLDREQALHRIANDGILYQAELDYNKPLKMKDVFRWNLENVLKQLKAGENIKQIKDKAASLAKQNGTSMRAEENKLLGQVLTNLGYDAIEYENQGEGKGKAIIVWKPEQIKSFKQIDNLNEEEPYQKYQKKVHPARKSRLITKGNNKTKTYPGKPSTKRAKSAPPGAGGT